MPVYHFSAVAKLSAKCMCIDTTLQVLCRIEMPPSNEI